MFKDAQVARDDLVLQNGTGWNIDSITMIGNDDHRALKHINTRRIDDDDRMDSLVTRRLCQRSHHRRRSNCPIPDSREYLEIGKENLSPEREGR